MSAKCVFQPPVCDAKLMRVALGEVHEALLFKPRTLSDSQVLFESAKLGACSGGNWFSRS